MAASTASSKNYRQEWRKLVKKYRRKRIRKAQAIRREREQEKILPVSLDSLLKEKLLAEYEQEEEERQREARHLKWLLDEEEAQKRWAEENRLKTLQEDERKEAQLRIKMEWEAARKKRKEKEKLEQDRQKEVEARIENFIKEGGEVPEELRTINESNPGKEPCLFFKKVGVCRFGPSCSRNHSSPSISRIILIPNFYSHFTLHQNRSTEYDTDVSLEFEETDTNKDFREFFEDVTQELKRFGDLSVVLVCRNSGPHLRGNLYAEYTSHRYALLAARSLNARWYGGRQISVKFVTIPEWGAAICGDFNRERCPKGAECNFLHVFRNPGGDLRPKLVVKEKFVERDHPSRHWRWSESPEPERRSSRSRSTRSSRQKSFNSDRCSRSRRSRSRDSFRKNNRDRSPSHISRRSKSREKKISSNREKSKSQFSKDHSSRHRGRRKETESDVETFSDRMTAEDRNKNDKSSRDRSRS